MLYGYSRRLGNNTSESTVAYLARLSSAYTEDNSYELGIFHVYNFVLSLHTKVIQVGNFLTTLMSPACV